MPRRSRILGSVREAPFHLVYLLFSIIAALSMLSLARRFCDKPLLATLLFLAVPAFVVNGNSLEADLPFLALWMATVALYVKAVDRHSPMMRITARSAAMLAALAAYQAVLLLLVLPLYALEPGKRRRILWSVALAAPVALGAWQLYEQLTSGRYPAAMLAGYLRTYGLEAAAQKMRNAAALIAHLGWIVSPLLALIAFFRGSKWRWIGTAAAAAGAAIYDPNPLFWGSFACGVLILVSCVGRGFLGAWVLVFFAGALVVFFAGSARYLLPIAAPVAILVTRSLPCQHFGGRLRPADGALVGTCDRQLPALGCIPSIRGISFERGRSAARVDQCRVGITLYLESEGALPLPKGQMLQAGDIVVSSELALPLPIKTALTPIAEREIRPAIPLRLISLDRRSAYSVASARGLLPFEFSTGPIDRVRADLVIERDPQLTYIDPKDPHAEPQIIEGLFQDGWMTDRATVLLKPPRQPSILAGGHLYASSGSRAACTDAHEWPARRRKNLSRAGRVYSRGPYRQRRKKRHGDAHGRPHFLCPTGPARSRNHCDRNRLQKSAFSISKLSSDVSATFLRRSSA